MDVCVQLVCVVAPLVVLVCVECVWPVVHVAWTHGAVEHAWLAVTSSSCQQQGSLEALAAAYTGLALAACGGAESGA
jgi:hypothetical protein